MRFSWDKTKSRANLRKHGVSFEAAQLVFEDPLHLTRQDRIESGELRWQTIGMANNMMLLLVAHTWIDGGEQHIRIISARKASKSERRIYEQSP
ncbi:MAG: BrnT family toxin (plasmid) [Candidatus Symbiodolus clandestinus]